MDNESVLSAIENLMWAKLRTRATYLSSLVYSVINYRRQLSHMFNDLYV